MSDQTGGKMAEFLRDHPRMMGVLFALLVLLTQVQPVLAGCASGSCSG